MDCCCPDEDLTEFKKQINKDLGTLYSEYFNITYSCLIDDNGYIVDYHIHSDEKDKSNIIDKVKDLAIKACEFKMSSIKAAKLLGFKTTSETFIKADTHIILTYELMNYLLVIVVEMSSPLIECFDFEKFKEKIDPILLNLRQVIKGKFDNVKNMDSSS